MRSPPHRRAHSRLLLAALALVAALAPAAAHAVVPPPPEEGFFTCRASALRVELVTGQVIEPFVANDGEEVCMTDDGSLLNETFAAAPGALTVKVLSAETMERGHAESAVVDVIIEDAAGETVLRATVLHSQAEASCGPGGPTLESESRIVRVVLPDGTVIEDPGAHTDIPLGPLGTAHLNHDQREATDDGEVLTRRALWLEATPVGEVVVAEAVADYHGNPCGDVLI